MEDIPGDQQNKSELNKSKASQDAGLSSCTATHISAGKNSGDIALVKYEIDESLDIKEEIVQDPEREYDQTLEIKEEIQLDQQIKLESKESTESQISGPSYYTPKYISSGNNSSAKTKIEYSIDETLDIKEEIVPERHQWEKHNLRSERNRLDEKCTIPETSSDNNSGVKTTIEYHNDENLEIKEESVQDHEYMDQRFNKKCESKLHTLDTTEADILPVKEPGTSKKKKLQEPNLKPKKKYSCEKCARSYVHKQSLSAHKKFECGVMPQFKCALCGKQFKIKSHMNRHILSLHRKTDPKALPTRHNCDKCSQSYTYASSLRRHKCLEHAAVSPQYICDYCGFKTKGKKYLSRHITSRHFQTVHLSVREKKYKCEDCGRRYLLKTTLNRHKKFECDVIPQFCCESCGKQFKQKGNMDAHILRVHKKTNLKTPQIRYNCDKCSRSYIWPGDLRRHKRLEHAAIRPRFICDLCCFQTERKNYMANHITSKHFSLFNS